MRHYDEELRELQQQAAMKNRLETIIKELKAQKSMLESHVEELASQKDKEQLDVDRLERGSLANYFYQVVGKLDDKLTKEKKEAYEAAVKYDTAYRELQAVDADLRMKELEYGRIHRSDEKYKIVLKEKQEAIKLSGAPEAGEIFRLEAQISSLDTQLKELEEAISAGKTAEYIADDILQNLSSAEGWGTWDMIGGGLITDLTKHSHLDDAQEQVGRLQRALSKFKTELADVEIIADMKVNVDGFLRFADVFFDGLFSAWSVMNQIKDAQGQVKDVKNQISSLLYKLNATSADVKQEQTMARYKLQELVRKTEYQG